MISLVGTGSGPNSAIVALFEMDETPEQAVSARTVRAREAAVGIVPDAIVIDLGMRGEKVEDASQTRRLYVEARPDGWRIYVHSDGTGDCGVLSVTDQGLQVFTPPAEGSA
ncbi:MAG: hypothetical protein F8N36_12095 [Desulfovibrio sp.]|uniref:hypothetical protein n=1 Tax=Desulfovibrio sp. TaxID=885 RepID=UPI00135D7935|nr:hypothetical protein [Desulfovibrio sp.]MTJ93589.1 hypothetical protein [Desulfovibrio sp.]